MLLWCWELVGVGLHIIFVYSVCTYIYSGVVLPLKPQMISKVVSAQDTESLVHIYTRLYGSPPSGYIEVVVRWTKYLVKHVTCKSPDSGCLLQLLVHVRRWKMIPLLRMRLLTSPSHPLNKGLWNKVNYSGISLIGSPLGPHEVSWLKKVSLFQRLFCILLCVAGIIGSVLIIRGVLISEVLSGEVPLFIP